MTIVLFTGWLGTSHGTEIYRRQNDTAWEIRVLL